MVTSTKCYFHKNLTSEFTVRVFYCLSENGRFKVQCLHLLGFPMTAAIFNYMIQGTPRTIPNDYSRKCYIKLCYETYSSLSLKSAVI
jgi:hypothetical protein